ncbi:MAG: Ref family recombination enhancement nuclease [Rhodanobacter sp.]
MKRTPLKRRTPLRASGPSLSRQTALTTRTRLVSRTQIRAKARPRANAAQVERWVEMKAIGCIACLLNGAHGLGIAPVSPDNPLEIQHMLSGTRRIGHDATVCWCHYHHQGKRLPHPAIGYRDHASLYGPSFGHEPNRFREMYGSDKAQMERQRELLANFGAQHQSQSQPSS